MAQLRTDNPKVNSYAMLTTVARRFFELHARYVEAGVDQNYVEHFDVMQRASAHAYALLRAEHRGIKSWDYDWESNLALEGRVYVYARVSNGTVYHLFIYKGSAARACSYAEKLLESGGFNLFWDYVECVYATPVKNQTAQVWIND
jgi:hypothetical protein